MNEEREELLIKLTNAYKALEFKENLVKKYNEYKKSRDITARDTNLKKTVLKNYKEKVNIGIKEENPKGEISIFRRKEVSHFIILAIVGLILVFILLYIDNLLSRWITSMDLNFQEQDPYRQMLDTLNWILLWIYVGGVIVFIVRRKDRKRKLEIIAKENEKIKKHNHDVAEANRKLNPTIKEVDTLVNALEVKKKSVNEMVKLYNEYIESDEYKNSIDFLSNERKLNSQIVAVMYYIVSSGRADTLKEMLNKYDSLMEHNDLMNALNVLNTNLDRIRDAINNAASEISFQIRETSSQMREGFSNINSSLYESRQQTAVLLAEQERANQTLHNIDEGLNNRDLRKPYR